MPMKVPEIRIPFLKKKMPPSDEELFDMLLEEILDERAKKIWERIKDI